MLHFNNVFKKLGTTIFIDIKYEVKYDTFQLFNLIFLE